MIIDFNNNLVSDAVLEEEEYIPKGFIPEKEENMEFIKLGDKYLIKDSNGKVINEKEKLELEKQGIVLEDITSNNCQEENTKKIKKIKKQVKKIEEAEELPEVTEDAVITEAI
jgi:hypothetical protein